VSSFGRTVVSTTVAETGG